MHSVGELYDREIRALPTSERLRLATMILEGIPERAVVDYDESWSDEDLRDFARASWDRLNKKEAAINE